MTYGLPFNGDEDGKGLLLLNAVEETICRQLRACKATSSKRRVLEGTFFVSITFFVILHAHASCLLDRDAKRVFIWWNRRVFHFVFSLICS